ncbi:BrnT family toxin [Chromohalobacter sp. TMW 2.2308]|uniref:BrnT family toxin n=1 Tax=Chromohalobacter moromii TaxID=2860329 RepID=A0A9X2WZX4_9GAMM|nr:MULTISPECIES: BrnT family toxin [Chromohalobacter]MCK2042159.1 BrnT family toxin [Chromohalobacter moromii]MCK2045067.1 BrnT family toxin [Chromohalobacter moromii]MCT8468054.1 BrnT family toxin [Chromohalobacter canadensis]MCT8498551.1 BrnT family toxin [Chromohalobacter canadensis]MCT8503784.1 BrnT family toxin [Chromohalobacter moromii]
MSPHCEIEYDEAKRLITLENRGVDFADVPQVFAGRVYSGVDARKDYGEERIYTVGKLNERAVVIVWTWRGSKRRIISMRYANDREKRRFKDYLD